jgi:hypothetical protein
MVEKAPPQASRRRRRHMHRESRCEAAVQALTELEGFPEGSHFGLGQSPIGHVEREVIARRVADFGIPPTGFATADGKVDDNSFFDELLGMHSGYGHEPQSLVALDPSLLSLPEAGAPPLVAFDNDSISGSPKVAELIEQFVLPTADGQRQWRDSSVRHAYLDPSLRSGGRRYAAVVSLLVSRGVLELTSEPGICERGGFAVRKKCGGQRLVIDARPANLFLSTPLSTRLPSALPFRTCDVSPLTVSF